MSAPPSWMTATGSIRLTAVEEARLRSAGTASWMATELENLSEAIGNVRDLRKEWEYSESAASWTHRRSGMELSSATLADRVLEYLSTWDVDTASGQAYPMETAAVDSERLEAVAACLLHEEDARIRRDLLSKSGNGTGELEAAVTAVVVPPDLG